MSLENDIAGLQTIAEWLGSGGIPVSPNIAEQRAATCLSCPEHRPAKWWETAKGAIAEAIRRHIAVKTKMNISVPQDEQLGMCKACGCCTRLKVHVPLDHILNHHAVSEFPSNCWIVKEFLVKP